MNNRKRSQKQERRLAREMGGKVQPGSGSVWNKKGDVMTERLFIEAKTTGKKQYTLKAETLEKVAEQCNNPDQIPVLIITFERSRRDFAILPKEDLQLLIEEGRKRGRAR